MMLLVRVLHKAVRRTMRDGSAVAARLIGAAAVAVVTSGVLAARAESAPVEVASPDGTLVARLDLAAPALSATLDGAPLLEPERLGLRLDDADLTSGLTPVGEVVRTAIDEAVTTSTGPARRRRHRANELHATFAGAGGRRLGVRLRVTDDGLAFRYELPGPPATLRSEAGGFAPAGAVRSWLAPHTPTGESLWGGPSESTLFGRPGEHLVTALLQLGGRDRFVLLTEAGVDGRHAASRLVEDGRRLRFALPRKGDTTALGAMESGAPVPVATTADWAGPWRVAIAGRLSEVATSTLVADLAAPPRGDFAWVQPGVAAWSWWSDNASPRSYDRQRAYVDFAARHGWAYVTVDEGWPALGGRLDDLVVYAARRGVRLLLWFNKRTLTDPARRAAELDRIAGLGVAGIKVDFFDDETQATMQLVDDLLGAAAARRLLVDLHGYTVPRGLERTWPNLLTFEGVRGAEYYLLSARFAGIVPVPGPVHDTIVAFTRAVAGPADFTPVTFSAQGRSTSDAFELALALVLQTGLLHPADRIEEYEARPEATAVLDRLPVTWDATRLVEGFPGRGVTLARRHGSRWWIGSLTAGAAREVAVPLDLLGPGRWSASITQDAPGPDVATRRREVTASDTLRLDVERDGGFVVELRRTDCSSRRRVPITLPAAILRHGVTRIRVRVTGRPTVVWRGARRSVTVDLTGSGRGAARVRLDVRGRDGRTRTVRRTFVTCGR